MSYLLDASAFLPLITTHGKSLISEVARQKLFIADLTIYEACNSLWKLSALLRTITPKEAEILATVIKDTITHGIIKVTNYDKLDLSKTLELAREEETTFYDASYITSARSLGAVLVTEDERLRGIADKYLNVVTYAEFVSKLRKGNSI